jgi:hypothetical protein
MKKGSSKKRPSTAALREIPEADFSRAIHPHRYARLRPGYRYTVFLEPELWQHFGSADEVKAALRALVGASKHVKAAGES